LRLRDAIGISQTNCANFHCFYCIFLGTRHALAGKDSASNHLKANNSRPDCNGQTRSVFCSGWNRKRFHSDKHDLTDTRNDRMNVHNEDIS